MSEYAKTMAFWKAKLKYPTSQSSLDNIRKAFGVDEVLSNFQRNHQQFETLFNIKSEIKERYSEAKTNDILFVLSMLTIASVLTDSVDFIAKVVDFKDLFEDFDISLLADASMTKEELLSVLSEFYTPEKQAEYGVVGIRLRLI